MTELTRRHLLAVAGAGLAAAAPVLPEELTLLVAGVAGGPADGWADWLAPALSRSMPGGSPVGKLLVGGADGVTGANQFDARTDPDGGTALLVPGAAAMAWLVGDPRARYDAGRWVPTLAAVTFGVIASRLSLGQILGGTPIRIAATGPAGADLPALLALDLLGANWHPLFGPPEATAAHADAVFLHGRNVPEAARAAFEAGLVPVMGLGAADETVRSQRDPAFPDLPDATELMGGRTTNDRLVAAYRAAARAADLDVALVLPQQAPAAMVAVWRRACAQAAGPMQKLAQPFAVRPLTNLAANLAAPGTAPDTASLLELRRWLSERLDYRPS